MIKAVLFDLDDTLITNPINRMEHSLASWGAFFQRELGSPDAAMGLAAGLIAVSQNTNPVENNFDVFLREAMQQWAVNEDRAIAIFKAFYAETYVQMRQHIAPRADAVPLLDWLREAGYAVVIATNPLFMADALAQRMTWGSIPNDFGAYALVTHLENMQFAKPTPHYYEEIAGRLGIATSEALMVGDDWRNDITPAAQAGMNTFWVRPDGTPSEDGHIRSDGEGTLHDLAVRICNQDWLSALEPHPLTAAQIGPRLLGNVGALFSLLREHAPDYWWRHPDPAEWSPLEVVCHLRDSERAVQRPRLERITTEDNPFLSAPHDPPGPGEIGCETDNYCDPAEEFAAERQRTVDFLAALPAETWDRPARHSIFGPTTLLEMANFTATHDRLHLQQICQTIGRCE
jgi:FMN phosphatase YigB (HAD superfamily)